MPVTTRSVSRLRPSLSQTNFWSLVLMTSIASFDTSTVIHCYSSSQFASDRLTPAFSHTLTTLDVDPKPLWVIWGPVLQPDPEGPALISDAA